MGGLFGAVAAVKFALMVMRTVGWFLATLWLGAVTVLRVVRYAWRLRLSTRENLVCPRGHDLPSFQVYECEACHANGEGWVFGPCRHCGSTPGWVACPVCQVAVGHPVRW